LQLYAKVIYLLITKKYDLVYITPCASGLQFYKDYCITQFVKLLHKGKIIYHFHNKGILSNKNVPTCIKKNFFKRVHVILLSPLLYFDIQKFVLPQDVSYLPNGIQLGIKKAKNNNGIPEILFVSNMIRTKGVFDLLQACTIVNSHNIDFHCSFVGPWYDITHDEFMDFVIKNDITSKVSYVGAKYGDEKTKLFQNADIFIFPTYYPDECFPLVLLEAMSFSLPCISTNEAAIPEIVDNGKTGFIVPKMDPEALAEKIEILLNINQLREEMGQAGKAKFEEKYTLQVFEKNFIQIIGVIMQ
jgi:glycosyltransferase involved in cell wall biosynthesis